MNTTFSLISKSVPIHKRQLFQQWKDKIQLELSDIVKIEIGDREHGYVRIARMHKNRIWGKIDVDPVTCSKKYDDIIRFNASDIEEVLTKFILIPTLDKFKNMPNYYYLDDATSYFSESMFVDNCLLVINNEITEWIPRKNFAS